MKTLRGSHYLRDLHTAAARLDAEAFRGKTLLVTGACGMIGGCTADMLLALDSMYSLSMTLLLNARSRERLVARYGSEGERMRFVVQDVTEPMALPVRADYVIHAASGADPRSFRLHPVEVMKANLLGTLNLLELLRAQGSGRMVFVSSGEVYGEGGPGVAAFTEGDSGYVDPAMPRSCYPSSKRAAETLCVSYAAQYGVDALIARPCHTYGQTMTDADNRAASEFLRKGAAGEPIVLRSPGLQVRNYCYVVDMALGLLTVCARGASATAYNIAPDNAVVSIRDLAELIGKIAGCPVIMEANGAAPGPIQRGVLSSDSIQALGWQPLLTLEEAVDHVITDMREEIG
ncbi:MAG: NAD-dependent epimerase/dehydratase family protein [Aristaeellaceae bacterium]